MQTPHVHRVQPGDEINQVLRAVKSAKGSSFCLVLPPDSPLLRNDLNLRLLVAYAREKGLAITLVTSDPPTISRAAAYGVAVYASVEDALRPDAEPISQGPEGAEILAVETDVQRKRRSGRLAIIGLALLACAIVAVVFRPRVEIQIIPELSSLTWTEVVASERLPTTIETVTLTSTGEAAASGTVRVGQERARGVVVFFNEGASPTLVPAGTLVTTQSGVAFATETAVTVPARDVVYFLDAPVGVAAGRAEVWVQAVLPGEEGNVAEGRIRIIENLDLSVRNPEPLTGGSDRVVAAVTTTDVERAKGVALDALDTQIEEYLASVVSARPELALAHYEIDYESPTELSAKAGEPTERVVAHVQAELAIHWFDRANLYAILSQTIPERLPMGYTWEQARGFDVSIQGFDQAEEAVSLHVTVPLVPTFDGLGLAGSVAGLTPSEAIDQLREQPGIADVRILGPERGRLPQWAPWIAVDVLPVSGPSERQER